MLQLAEVRVRWPVAIASGWTSALFCRQVGRRGGGLRRVQVNSLVIEEHVGSQGGQHACLLDSSEEVGLLDPYVPGAQGVDHPLGCACRAVTSAVRIAD